MRHDSSAWVPVGPYGFSADHVNWLDMALDPFGTPTVSYETTGRSSPTSAPVSKATRSASSNGKSTRLKPHDNPHLTIIDECDTILP
jgi:hypothetical protein